ncbi:TIGR04255 family protein [Pseudomonas mosselii]|uniref:TIGR04255 family protein n=1 Tax=Pseudomonas mosselii TaxID=78327 RepID=UPI002DB9A52F|nr:TIGR04255 family protein [Pseudomonas mosselii]MEB5934961.1 TIGR04255 family protein [Pseudomonas mosselii]
MIERFDSSPLIELIAEVRWPVDPGSDPSVPFSQGPHSQNHEDFLSRLLAELSLAGYGASERLIPPGFPLMKQAPVVRYKKSGAQASTHDLTASTLFQAGAGIFTINAVQPYKCWEQFRPVVENGLSALIAAKPPTDGGFDLVLRYIDAFKDQLTGGRPLREFLAEVMGVHIQVPEALRAISKDGSAIVPMLHIVIPLHFGSLQIQFAEGELQGERVYLMENVVTVAQRHEPDVQKVLTALDEAREVVHKSFVDLTRSIHNEMGISEGE